MSLSGLAEIEEGEVEGHKIHLVSHTVGRTSFNKDPKVVKVGSELKPACIYSVFKEIQVVSPLNF